MEERICIFAQRDKRTSAILTVKVAGTSREKKVSYQRCLRSLRSNMTKKHSKKHWTQKAKRHKKISLAIIIVLLLGIFFMGIAGDFTGFTTKEEKPYLTTNLVEQSDSILRFFYDRMIRFDTKTKCRGMDKFFNGFSFDSDYRRMKKKYNECYSNGDIKFNLMTAENLSNCDKYFDCEDFSFVVNCLASLYGIDCEYSMGMTYRGFENETSGHIGLHCYVDNEWLKYN